MVNLKQEVSKSDLSFVYYQISQINLRVANIKTDLYRGDDINNPHDISPEDIEENNGISLPQATIMDCQIIVELSAKSIFKSLGVNPVQKHDITFDNERVSGLLGRIPEGEDFTENVPRVIFLTQFWERFYTLAKYGVPEQNLSSFELMEPSDALRAVQDAEFCQETASEVFYYVLDELDLETQDLDANPLEYV